MVGISEKVVLWEDEIHTNGTVFAAGTGPVLQPYLWFHKQWSICILLTSYKHLTTCPYKVTLQRGLLQSLPLECQARQLSIQCANSCSIIKFKQTLADFLECWPREPICLNFAKVFRVKTGKIWEKICICWKPSMYATCHSVQNDIVHIDLKASIWWC